MVRALPALAGAAACLALGGVIGWASAVALQPPPSVVAEASHVLVEARRGRVSQEVPTVVTATWPARAIARNHASGTITRVNVARGDEVSAGDVLFWVDERPVVALKGDVPAFRPLRAGTVGTDVSQLTEFLVARGHLARSTRRFDSGVQRAVRAWQGELGVPQTGELPRGEVVFVGSLPMRVALGPEFGVGSGVSDGEPAIEALSEAPVITATYGEAQARQVSAGMTLRIQAPPGEWIGIITSPAVSSGVTLSEVIGVDGSSVCGPDCSAVPLSGTVQWEGSTEIQPPTEGIIVPVAALVSGADGTTAVIDSHGARLPVSVRARARGMAVVEGVEAGMAIRVPGQ